MKLYCFPRSSASIRVRIALNLKRLNAELVLVDFRKNEQRSEAFLAKNPSGLVPLLEEGGLQLSQSLSIIQYLDWKHPTTRLIPEDPTEAALAMEIALAIGCDIHPLNNLRVLTYLEGTLGADERARAAWYANWIHLGFEAIEPRVHRYGGPYCLGDKVTIADVCLVPQIYNARRYKVELRDFPTLLSVDRHCSALSEFRAALPTG